MGRNRSERSDYVDVRVMCVPEQDLGRKCWRVEVQMLDIVHKRDEHGGSVECLLRRRRLLRVHCTVQLFQFMHILLALASVSFTNCGLWAPRFFRVDMETSDLHVLATFVGGLLGVRVVRRVVE